MCLIRQTHQFQKVQKHGLDHKLLCVILVLEDLIDYGFEFLGLLLRQSYK